MTRCLPGWGGSGGTSQGTGTAVKTHRHTPATTPVTGSRLDQSQSTAVGSMAEGKSKPGTRTHKYKKNACGRPLHACHAMRCPLQQHVFLFCCSWPGADCVLPACTSFCRPPPASKLHIPIGSHRLARGARVFGLPAVAQRLGSGGARWVWLLSLLSPVSIAQLGTMMPWVPSGARGPGGFGQSCLRPA